MTIGNRISELRKAKGYTQEYVAEQLGVSRQAVSKWEQNQTSPDTKNLIALSSLLGVSIEFLAMGSTPAPQQQNTNWLTVRMINRKITAGYWMLGIAAILFFFGIFLEGLLILLWLIALILTIVGIVKLVTAAHMEDDMNEMKRRNQQK